MAQDLRGFGNMLSALRNNRRLSQIDLATMIGVNEKTVQRWENGRQEPDIQQLDKLMVVLQLRPDDRRAVLFYLGYTENPLIPSHPRENHHLFGNFLRSLRLKNLYTQYEVAREIDVDIRTYVRWESGINIPDPDTITVLFESLRLTIHQFHALRVLAGYGPPVIPTGRFGKDLKAFGQTLREIRQYKGWLMSQLAPELPVAIKTYSRWENGRFGLSYQDFVRLHEVLVFTPEQYWHLKDLAGYGRPIVPEEGVYPNLKRFGQVLAQFRISEGIDQKQLARAVGVDTRTIRRWEAGQFSPRLQQLGALRRPLRLDNREFWYLEALNLKE